MTKISNHLPTAELQALDAAHHVHPFTTQTELAERGARVITGAQGCWLTDSEGHSILDAMAGLWCVNIGYGRDELADVAARQMRELHRGHVHRHKRNNITSCNRHGNARCQTR